MIRRIRHAIKVASRAAAHDGRTGPVAASEPAAAWALVHVGDTPLPEADLAAHRALCRARGYRCLVISDRLPPSCITPGEAVFEFVPWPLQMAETRPGGLEDAADYSFRRLGLIFGFWKVAGCTWSGPGAAELLELAPRDAHPLVRISIPKGRPPA